MFILDRYKIHLPSPPHVATTLIDCTCPQHNSASSTFHPRHVLFSIYLISCILRIELGFHFHKSCASLNIICSAPVEGFFFFFCSSSSSVVGFVLPTDVAAAARQGNFLRSISPSACAHLDSRSQSHFHSDSWYSHTNVRRNHKLLREVCNIIPEICVSASPRHSFHPFCASCTLPATGTPSRAGQRALRAYNNPKRIYAAHNPTKLVLRLE